MSKAVVFTALFGNRDVLRDPETVSDDVDYICFSDRYWTSDIWRTELVEPMFRNPRRDARRIKLLSHLFLPEHDISLWLDGRIYQKAPFSKIASVMLEQDSLIGAFSHPFRDCLYQEGGYCHKHEIDKPRLIREQLERYKKLNYPEHNGLCETGALIRVNCHAVSNFNESWWSELSRFSLRDQISFNFEVWSHSIALKVQTNTLRTTNLFKLYNHSRKC